MTERCEGCGFVWSAFVAAEIGTGILDATDAIVARLRAAGDAALVRAEPTRWSALEYAAHTRDVLFSVRDRVVQTTIEDDPRYAMIWRDERVDRGLYAGDTVEQVAGEIEVAGSLFARTFDRIDPALLGRTGVYTYPTAAPRTVLWIAAQALHECRHHLEDIDAGFAALA